MSAKQKSRRRVVNAALNAQWIVTATYRSERGPVVPVNHIEELQDLADLIEDGPWFDTLIEVQVVPNPLQPTYFRAISAFEKRPRRVPEESPTRMAWKRVQPADVNYWLPPSSVLCASLRLGASFHTLGWMSTGFALPRLMTLGSYV
jgi:hypothetical protein